jgi:oligogalacturonide lyase
VKGDLFPSELSSFRDRATDRLVHQVTSDASISHPTYFLQSSFVPDGSAILFTSYRTGWAQLFEAALPAGELRQLTEDGAIHPYSPAIYRDGEEVCFVRGGAVWTLNRKTLRERCVTEFPGGQLGECSLTADGEWATAAAKINGQSGIVTGRMDGRDWRLIPFPRTVIHPQFHPQDPQWLIFAGDPAPRMFRVRRDGSGMECLHQHDNEEFIVHETFLGASGDIVFTIWPRALCTLDWTTREIRTICECNAWHIAPNRAGTQVLCDTNHPDRGIFLIDVKTGTQHQVCLSEATNQGSQWKTSRYALAEDFAAARSAAKTGALSWMETSTDTVYGPQWTHPHPSFSADERKIAFASDRTGVTQVYIVEL